MCKASEYLKELQSITTRIHNDFETLTKKQSEYDKLLSEKYHEIENANFNACEGYYHARQLQEILRQRRIVKDEMHRMSMLHKNLNCPNLKQTINKTKGSLDKHRNTVKKYKGGWRYSYDIETILEGGEIECKIH